MAQKKPTAAMILLIIGGVFILLAGIAVIAIGGLAGSFLHSVTANIPLNASTSAKVGNVASTVSLATLLDGSIGGVIFGIVIILAGVMISKNPAKAKMWGIVALVLSIISIFTVLGGFVIGFILALIGSILAIVYKP